MSIEAFNQSTGELTQQSGFQFPPSDTVVSLAEWAQELDAAYALAQSLCKTSFVPAHFRGKPEEGAVAMLYGKTLGLAPVVALRSIYSVHGTPALYAQQMYAIAISHGHQIERVHATETSVKFRARRKGSQNWQEVEWTIERARKAKYTSNPKYQENPIGMLTEKCKAEAAKLVAADALAGMASVEEVELGDYDVVDVTEVPHEVPEGKAKVTTIKRKTAKAPEPTPPPAIHDAPQDDEEEDEQPDIPVLVLASRSQQSRLGKALDAIGVEDNAKKAEEVQRWAKEQGITRDVKKSGDLTVDEMEDMIGWLEGIAATTEAAAETWESAEVPS